MIHLPGALSTSSPLVARWLARPAEGVYRPYAGPWLLGDDVSDWQTIDWAQLPPLDFYITKATQGTGYVASTFANNREQARLRGAPSGIYHFMDWGDPDAEAAHFLNTVGLFGPMEFLLFDAEGAIFYADPVGCDPKIERFCSIVEAANGRQPSQTIDYMSDSFARRMPATTARRRLNDATYPFSGDPNTWGLDWGAGPWPKVTMTQFTSKGTLPGIAGGVDLDIAVLDLAAQLGLTQPSQPQGGFLMALSDKDQATVLESAVFSREFGQEVKDAIVEGGNGDYATGLHRLSAVMQAQATKPPAPAPSG